MPKVQGREDFRVHLQGGIGIVECQHQVAAAFAQGMHRIADVGRHQARGDIQALVTQLGDPAWEEAQCQRVRSRHLHDLALPAFEMMKVAQDLAQLLDHRTRRHQEQLACCRKLDRCARTVYQSQPQRRLQATDTPAECRLSNKAALGRLGKAAGSRQCAEVFQPFAFKVHEVLQRPAKRLDTFDSKLTSQQTLCRLCIGQCVTALARNSPRA
ncbi:hypothetical protein D3C86_1544000 [compost metagenome]